MDLVKIKNIYINPDRITNVYLQPILKDNLYAICIEYEGGSITSIYTERKEELQEIVEKLTTPSLKQYAKRLKEYCAKKDNNCHGCLFSRSDPKGNYCFIDDESGETSGMPRFWNIL